MSEVFKKVVLKGVTDALEKGDVTPEKIEMAFNNSLEELVDNFIADQALRDQAIEKFEKSMNLPKRIVIENNGVETELEGLNHFQTGDLLKIINADLPTMIVGMPGAGKTTACELIAKALNLDFHAISVGMQTTKSDIMGFIDANGNYQASSFRKAFENGGLFLMDEVDAGNPNVLILINSAISNGFCEFGDKMVQKHEDFRFVATANTFGNGMDNKFVGRNKLDAATLDRFVVFGWEIDESLEEVLSFCKSWLDKIRNLRQAVSESHVNILVTPRMAILGGQLVRQGFDHDQVAKMIVYKGLDRDTTEFIKGNLK